MDSRGKIIDLSERRKKKSKKTAKSQKTTAEAPVYDMAQKRQEILDSERRGIKRTILSEFIGANIVIPQKGLQKCTIYDISDSGLAFDLPKDIGKLNIQEEIAMRVYLNHETFFPFIININYIRDMDGEGVYRHGASFVKGTINDTALHHFIKFIENVSATLKTDKGDVVVSNLKN